MNAASADQTILDSAALVLNRSWLAIATTTVREALAMMYTGTARAIRPETYEVHEFDSWASLAVPPDSPCVRTVTLRIRVPEVIVLSRLDRLPPRAVPFTRRNLFRRDRDTCQYCGAKPGRRNLSIDHVVPRSKGGESSWTNCVLACLRCNRRKADLTPREANMPLRKKPKAPPWEPTLGIPIGQFRQSWERFISERYWNVPLEP
ncbi:MAG: HNH endonuclease [Planctomycetes bacterium]|nr:HNH endonuclease [Planctomycetota bacterium]